VKTATRFTSLAWGQVSPKSPRQDSAGEVPLAYPQGLLVGGLSDGSIAIWDAAAVMRGEGDAALLNIVEQAHTAAVRSLQFNPSPHHSHLIAAGSADCSISIVDLSNPAAPCSVSCVPGAPAPRAARHPQPALILPSPFPPTHTHAAARAAPSRCPGSRRRSWTTR